MAETRHLISFFKWRTWRFNDDLRAHVVAELLEDLVRRGRPLPPTAEREVQAFLAAQSSDGSTPFSTTPVAEELGIDLALDVERRLRYRADDSRPVRSPASVVCILGAPRSGTTTLLDRLAYHTDWAVITDHSHHLWPLWGLDQARHRFFRHEPPTVLDHDTRAIRLNPRISWPSEAENLLHRHIPTYHHLGGHRYQIHTRPTIHNRAGLQRAISKHLDWFGTDTLLLKSPFNATRLPALQTAIGGRWHVIHMKRRLDRVAASIRQAGFEYTIDGRKLDPAPAVRWFCDQADSIADLTAEHESLLADPTTCVGTLIKQVSNRVSSESTDSQRGA